MKAQLTITQGYGVKRPSYTLSSEMMFGDETRNTELYSGKEFHDVIKLLKGLDYNLSDGKVSYSSKSPIGFNADTLILTFTKNKYYPEV